jgi:signal transduction histidine kinase
MQAQAIRKRAQDGNLSTIDTQLTQLAGAAQQAHQDIRDSILNLRGEQSGQWNFFTALRQHLTSFQKHYGIDTQLTLSPGTSEEILDLDAGVQLLRVIQEAMTNSRKHGHANDIQVYFSLLDDSAGHLVRIVVADDGCGFDPDLIQRKSVVGVAGDIDAGAARAEDHLGLAFMRERMAQIRGTLQVDSSPGVGTRVIFDVPVRTLNGRRDANTSGG